MNVYKVTFEAKKVFVYEDPKCPWEWRGSGCYDVEVEDIYEGEATVWCEREKSVLSLLLREFEDMEDIEIVSCEFVDSDDGEEEEIVDYTLNHIS